MNRAGIIVALSAAVFTATAQQPSRPPVPRAQIVGTIRELAARQLQVRTTDVDLRKSLAAQGMSESGLTELVVDIGQELGVTLSSRAIFEAKQREPVQPLSVLLLADMVDARLRQPFPD